MALVKKEITRLAKSNACQSDSGTSTSRHDKLQRRESLLSTSSTCSSLCSSTDSDSSSSCSSTISSQGSSVKSSWVSSAASDVSKTASTTAAKPTPNVYKCVDKSNTGLRTTNRRLSTNVTATVSIKCKDRKGYNRSRSRPPSAESYNIPTTPEDHTGIRNCKHESKRLCVNLSGSETESVADCRRADSAECISTPMQTRSYNDIKTKYFNHIDIYEPDYKFKSSSHNFRAENSLFNDCDYSKMSNQERCCPLRDCDSLGHLGGSLQKHFTKEACPMYHNLSVNDCKAAFIRRCRLKSKVMEISHKPNPTTGMPSDKSEWELRVVLEDIGLRPIRTSSVDNGDMIDSPVNREPRLGGFASECDIQLFRDAQAIASENIEKDQNLPYAMGTKIIEIGTFDVGVWYQSPYPEDFAHVPKLFICEYCLHYMKSSTTRRRHQAKCVWRHPPGGEIYRYRGTSVWEVDGKKHREYCQNLCLLAKFFLDHKTLHDHVEPFFFYVMTVQDSKGCHAVGYFSKEKNSSMNYNVSCILIFPHYQRKGYGRLLIDFSYLLTRVEGKVGTPEKPLSDLGLISYRSYWKDVLLNFLHKFTDKELSIKDISHETGINTYDIVSTLQALSMIRYWKGKHIILKKQNIIEEYVDRVKKHGTSFKQINPLCLKWTPVSDC